MFKYKEDQFIVVADFFDKRKIISLDGKKLIIGKTRDSFLIGPKIFKNFCLICFKKRILSSNFFEVKDYISMTVEDIRQIKRILVTNKNQAAHNSMIEYPLKNKKQKIVHFILAVPCCNY